MALVLITYNIRAQDTDYDAVFKAIRGLGPTWHGGPALDSVWFLATAAAVDQVDRALASVMTSSDSWFVVDITGMPRQGWMPQDVWKWLDSTGG